MIWLLSWIKKQQQQHEGLSNSWLDNRMCQKRQCPIIVFLYKLLNPKTYGYLRRIAVAIHDLVTELEKEAAAAAWRVVRLTVRQ
jgi:hypothetical protein